MMIRSRNIVVTICVCAFHVTVPHTEWTETMSSDHIVERLRFSEGFHSSVASDCIRGMCTSIKWREKKTYEVTYTRHRDRVMDTFGVIFFLSFHCGWPWSKIYRNKTIKVLLSAAITCWRDGEWPMVMRMGVMWFLCMSNSRRCASFVLIKCRPAWYIYIFIWWRCGKHIWCGSGVFTVFRTFINFDFVLVPPPGI